MAGANGVPADATGGGAQHHVDRGRRARSPTSLRGRRAQQLPETSSSQPATGRQRGKLDRRSLLAWVAAVSFATNTGAIHLVIDVLGYYMPSGDDAVEPAYGRFVMLDTRYGPGPAGPNAGGSGVERAGQTIHLPLNAGERRAGRRDSVVVNITSTAGDEWQLAFVTAWPSGETSPDGIEPQSSAAVQRLEPRSREGRHRRRDRPVHQHRRDTS